MEYSSFKYRGISSRSMGLLIAAPPSISMPKLKESRVSVPGRNGTLRTIEGGYEDVTVTYETSFKGRLNEVERVGREMKAWLLAGNGEYPIEDSYDKQYYRTGSYSGGENITSVLNRGGKLNIAFTCNPMRRRYDGDHTYILASSGRVLNEEAFESLPYVRIYGNGEAGLYINSNTIRLKNIDGYIELDSELEQAFKGTANKNNTVTLAEFPKFIPGENTIQWDGGITKIEYIPRWCTL